MKTILYNTKENKVLHWFDDGYKVDGKPSPTYNDDVVELVVIDKAAPDYDPETQHITQTWTADIKAGTYTQSWTITDKTEAEIQAEKEATQAALEASSEYKIEQLEGVIAELIGKLNEKEIIQ
jgi:hypothetical protein